MLLWTQTIRVKLLRRSLQTIETVIENISRNKAADGYSRQPEFRWKPAMLAGTGSDAVTYNFRLWINYIITDRNTISSTWLPTTVTLHFYAVQWRTEGFFFLNLPPPKFRRSSKIVQNSNWLWKLLKIAEFRTPRPQDVRKKGSKILKLPLVRNCFTFAMTNKLVVIINSLKVPKIKKILLYEMKF